jgi:hypothetical protein
MHTIEIQASNVICLELGDMFPFQLMNMLDSFPGWSVQNRFIAELGVSQFSNAQN